MTRIETLAAPYETFKDIMVPWSTPLIYAMPPDQVIAVGVYSSAAVANGQTRRLEINGTNPSDTDFFVITRGICPPSALRLPPESGWEQDTDVAQVVPDAYRFKNKKFEKQFPHIPPPDVYFWQADELIFHTQGKPTSKDRVVYLDGDIPDNIGRIADSILHTGTLVYIGQPEELTPLRDKLTRNLTTIGNDYNKANQFWPVNYEWHNAIARNLQQMATRSLPYTVTM